MGLAFLPILATTTVRRLMPSWKRPAPAGALITMSPPKCFKPFDGPMLSGLPFSVAERNLLSTAYSNSK
eukprot:scaffold109923_cov30-Tisochrysis_lutea.AAC.4